MLNFKDKVAIVTGAGGGLGRSYAIELARRGARVVVNDLKSATGNNSASKVVAEIKAAGGEAIANESSVTDRVGVANLIEQTMDAFGRIDILINNAGILRDKSFQKMELDEVQIVLDVHLMGSFNCTKAVWPIMNRQNYGRVVMTTSPSGLYGNFGQANYGAAKMGLVGFMNTLRIEGAKKNIHTNSIAPVAGTNMTEGLIPKDRFDKLTPEKVAAGVIYLCSEAAPNGMILQAAGGRFSIAAIMETEWIDLGDDPTAEAVFEQWENISNLKTVRAREIFK